MLAPAYHTNALSRELTVDDFDSSENKTPVSLPTGTASAANALISLEDHWIEIDATQSWFWTEEWQAGERKVNEHIKAANIQTFETMEEFLRTLRE